MNALARLSTERQIGMGVGMIPWSKAREYFEFEGLRPPYVRRAIDLLMIADAYDLSQEREAG